MTYFVSREDGARIEGLTKEQIYELINGTTGKIPEGVDEAFITKLKEVNKGGNVSIWIGTNNEYNALKVKDDNTLYVIVDDSYYEDVDDRLTTLENRMSAVEEGFINYQNNMNSQFETYKNSMNSQFETFKEEINDEVNSIKSGYITQIDNLNGEISSLNGQIDNLNGEISSLNGQIDTIKNSMPDPDFYIDDDNVDYIEITVDMPDVAKGSGRSWNTTKQIVNSGSDATISLMVKKGYDSNFSLTIIVRETPNGGTVYLNRTFSNGQLPTNMSDIGSLNRSRSGYCYVNISVSGTF